MRGISHKQYLLSSIKLPLPEMTETSLNNGYFLYVGEGLMVRKSMTEKRNEIVLLGEAFCSNVFPREVTADFAKLNYDNLVEQSKYWTGRWVLVYDRVLITDACGLMSAFYFECPDYRCVSSSLALLEVVIGDNSNRKVSSYGLTWQLLPQTLHPSIRLLFCTQKMVCSEKGLRVEFINRYSEKQRLSFDQRVDIITSSLVNALKNIERFSGRQIWIALTAGKDSRLAFAAALAARINFATYTLEHKRISTADQRIPDQIAKYYGIKHQYIRRKTYSREMFREYSSFSGNNSLGADAVFYASDQFSSIPNDSIIIRSGLFEAGQSYARSIAGGDEESFIRGIRSYYKDSLKDPVQESAFTEWLDYQNQHPIEGMDRRDRFYLEQRLNGWAAAIEQSLDINDFISIQIANCSAVLGSLLYASVEDRLDLRLSKELIRRFDQKLLAFPINRHSWLDLVRNAIYGIRKRLFI